MCVSRKRCIDLPVDFNDLESMDEHSGNNLFLKALVHHSEHPLRIEPDATLLIGDDDDNTAFARIYTSDGNGVVWLLVDMDSFVPGPTS